MKSSGILGTISGTMLVPGVSRNNRQYTSAVIGKAVRRMQERIDDPNGHPIVMRTHHDAGDNSRLIVGRVTEVNQLPDGTAKYKAVIYNNEAARDLKPLLMPDETGKSALRTTSIHGCWLGPVEHQYQDGKGRIESGDDMEVNAIDFTWAPGVAGATLDSVELGEMFRREAERAVIHDGKNITEYGDIEQPLTENYNTAQRRSMASKGQAMKDGSYPIASKSDLRKAIRAVGRGNASHDAIRQHIMKRARALGLSDMIPDTWTSSGAKESYDMTPIRRRLTESTSISEHYIKVCIGDESGDMIEICAGNLHPDILKKAIKGAGNIIGDVMDGNTDIDNEDSDDMITDKDEIDYKVTICNSDDEADSDNDMAQGEMSTESHEADEKIEEAVMAEDKAVETATPLGLSEADMTKLAGVIAASITEAFKKRDDAEMAAKKDKAAKKAAKEAKATESEEKKDAGAELTETITPAELQQRLEENRKATIAELREAMLKDGGMPSRKGFRTVNETDGSKEDSLTGDELWNRRGEVWGQVAPAIFGLPEATA